MSFLEERDRPLGPLAQSRSGTASDPRTAARERQKPGARSNKHKKDRRVGKSGRGKLGQAHILRNCSKHLKAIEELRMGHWQTWFVTPLPQLGGVSPDEAVKTAKGRADVDGLLQTIPDGLRQDVAWLRVRLGLPPQRKTWRDFCFPKKEGDALKRAMPYVAEVYDYAYPSQHIGVQSDSERAWQTGRFIHMTHHAMPDNGYLAYRYSTVGSLAAWWLLLYPLALQVRCVACALLYSWMEYAFTSVERQQSYTTVAQFGANLLYVPILLDAYSWLWRMLVQGGVLHVANEGVAYVLCFPLNVYMLELVQDELLVALYGFNVAWCYKDYADELCNGVIRLGHAPLWLLLGLVCWYVYPWLVLHTERIIFV